MMDLILCAASVWAVFAIAGAETGGYFRIILGFFVVLLIPGYVLVSIVFTNRDQIDTLARLGLSVGFSIVIVSVTAYLLTYTPWELGETPTFLTLSLVTTFLCGIAFFQRYRHSHLPMQQFITGAQSSQLKSLKDALTERRIVIGTSVVAVLAVSALIYSSQGINSQSITEFSVLSASGKTSDYETRLAVGRQAKYQISVVNEEKTSMEYRLQLIPPDQSPIEVTTFVIGKGEKRELLVDYVPKSPVEIGKLQFVLYKNSESAPYKTVYLLITIAES